jgi:hypothetical protein
MPENPQGKNWLRLPVVSASSEYLVMGYLMRRNILAYKAPQNNEGYDLICIHPDPRHRARKGQKAQVRVQVKSRCATDSNQALPAKKVSFAAFDFLVVAFLNIGKFYGRNDGAEGYADPEFYTLSSDFVRRHHNKTRSWEIVRLKNLDGEIAPYKNERGFEQIAECLGIPRPRKIRGASL